VTTSSATDLFALTARAEVLERAAGELEARHEAHFASAARELRDAREAEAQGRAVRYVGALNLRGTWARSQHESRMEAEVNRRANYAFNVADDDRYTGSSKAGTRRRKTLADHRADYIADLVRWREESPADMPLELGRMLAELNLAADLAARANTDRRLAAILSGADDWLYDDADRELAEAEAVQAAAALADLIARMSAAGLVTDLAGKLTRSEATKQGIAAARTRGVRLGRPRTMPPETLVRLRELRAAGLSYRKIAAQMNTEGIPGSQGGRWHETSVRRALADYEAEGS
jgi:hypothetical protein